MHTKCKHISNIAAKLRIFSILLEYKLIRVYKHASMNHILHVLLILKL